MTIKDILARKASFSFEIFPPKAHMPLEPLLPVIEALSLLAPDFISVTCGAGGGTGGHTLEGALAVERMGIPALAHLTCVATPPSDISQKLRALKEKGIKNILALRGDTPGDGCPGGCFRHAFELVRQIKGEGGFCIGAACYPEGHPESPSSAEDWDYLKAKADSGVDFFTSQLFFDNDIFFKFLDEVRGRGVFQPVLAGIMPLTKASQLQRMCALSGAVIPPKLQKIIERFEDDGPSLLGAGLDYAAQQIGGLLQNGADGIHLYTMNQCSVAKALGNIHGA